MQINIVIFSSCYDSVPSLHLLELLDESDFFAKQKLKKILTNMMLEDQWMEFK